MLKKNDLATFGTRAKIIKKLGSLTLALSLLTGVMALGAGNASAAKHLSGGTSPGAVLLAAAKKTVGEKTAHLEFTGTISVKVGSKTLKVKLSGTGEMNLPKHAFSLNATIALDGITAQAHIVLIGDTAYVDIPLLSSNDGGKPWVKENLGSTAKAIATIAEHPTNLLGSIAKMKPKVKALGATTLDGQTVTKYSVSIKGKDVLNYLLKKHFSVKVRKFLKKLHLKTFTADAYVSQTGYLVGISVQLTTFLSSSLASGNVVLGFTQLGTPVTIKAPPVGTTFTSKTLKKHKK